jgi:hypothetical protein
LYRYLNVKVLRGMISWTRVCDWARKQGCCCPEGY